MDSYPRKTTHLDCVSVPTLEPASSSLAHPRTCVLLGNSHPRCSRPRPLPIFRSLPSLPTPFWQLQTTFSFCLVCVSVLSLSLLLTHATPHRSSWPRCLFLYPGRPSRQHRCTWGLVSRMGIITLMIRVCVLVSMTTTIPLLKPSSLPRTIMPSAVLFVSSGTHPLTHIHTHIHR